MLQEFIHWLGNTQASQIIQKVFWIIPTVQIAHILAISVVLASMAMFDLRLLGVAGKRHSIASFSRRFMPWLWSALIVLAASGSILIVGEPKRALGNVFFEAKMAMLATAIAVTLGFQAILKRDLGRGGSDLAPSHFAAAKVIGLVSLALWVAIAVAGRLIAYAG
ncbi:MAG: DUF6644 family protein [Steroidobacteraceae bacterium]